MLFVNQSKDHLDPGGAWRGWFERNTGTKRKPWICRCYWWSRSKGDRGLAARDGLPGVKGSPGSHNSNGEKGDKEGGEMEPMGQKGDKGEMGLKGATGKNGNRGDDCQVAYPYTFPKGIES